ncbi:putative cysteine-rich receptor-like protein kinase 35 [Citrus sinensis]|uniref:Cysteine-rich receptor-like protein kinase 35 n=1 Tax=Citrus sinensis TaxID=2711 RepID=A0ACB8NFA5_CITSI|nr:putative cysteine-rich receptor-like protein kinase 35 [Citrus sinensis]
MLLSIIRLTSGQTCYDTGNFTTNSTYGKNRDLFLSSLASNVTANKGFYTSTIGQIPDAVYGLALCRGDSTPESCASCLNFTVRDMMKNCPNQKEAISWGGMDFPCVVRYSNRSFFGKLELKPTEVNHNINNITSSLTQFDRIWRSLMDRVLAKASSGNSKLKFATEEANLTSSETIYALMQCTPDISQSDCEFCLRQSMADLQSCCYGKKGSYVLGPSCIFRWEMYPFYGATADSLSPSPLSPPSTTTDTTTTKDKGGNSISSGTVIIIVVSTSIFIIALVALVTCVFLRRRKQKQDLTKADEINTVESLQFDFSTIRDATNNFSTDNKLGQGGFGAVYKGRLSHGQEIAVKRLSKNSVQGELEFKNEVLLVARLQHRNLVRLLDAIKRVQLDWETRYKIIGGIARGILYLHEDSRLRIIHRDLKASNILLDADMIPKISDFGMARLFEMDQSQGDTSRIVGTFGYMAPEYVTRGNFSIKSDVFSFGVLVLEIISGQKNNSFRIGEEAEDLLTYAWKNWNEGTALNLIDPTLRNGSSSEIMRCIHIGLLCVQENVANRPTMASVVVMLNSSSLSLPLPSQPAFFMHTTMEQDNLEFTASDQSKSGSIHFTVNEVTVSELDPR